MGRKWMWFILVAALLLFISLEAATADNKGGQGGGGAKAGGEGQGGNSQGNGGGNSQGQDEGNGGHGKGKGGGGEGNDDGNSQGEGNGKWGGNGNGNGDENGNQDGNNGNGKGDGNGNGNDKGGGNGKGKGKGGENGNQDGNNGNGKGNGNGNGNGKGDGNGKGKGKGDENGNHDGNNGNGNGKGKGEGNGNKPPYYPPPFYPPPSQTPPTSTPPPSVIPPTSTPPSNPPPSTPSPPRGDSSNEYYMVSPVERTGQERAVCQQACKGMTLTCPAQCPNRRPRNNNMKGCYIDCSSKCEASCKWRKPGCDNYGSLCYDPRFVGGDGNMFFFHGSKGSDFAIVSDDSLQINAHFIGTRPMGRTRDFTWVQALSIMFDTHTLVLAANKVSKWDDKLESLIVKWDGEIIKIPTDGEAEWRINTENNNRVVIVERTDDFNTVRATVSGLVQVDTRVVPIGDQENKVHNYQIPSDDAFAHLETQFKFFKLSDSVEGVLGRTYQPGYESPVKLGQAMPTMREEYKYQTPSLNSPLCKFCRFHRPTSNSIAMVSDI